MGNTAFAWTGTFLDPLGASQTLSYIRDTNNGGSFMSGLTQALVTQPADQEGFDWDAAARKLVSRVVRQQRVAWGTPGGWHHHYYYRGAYYHHYDHHQYAEGPTWEELTAWMWTEETALAFGILLLALTVFLCCWVSHKIGEAMCTVVAGFAAMVLLVLVLSIFLSQWT